MKQLEIVIKEATGYMDGYGYDVIKWHLFIALNDPSRYKPESSLTVHVILNISNQEELIHIGQILPCSSILPGPPPLLPLSGTLWLLGKPEETYLVDYSVKLAYVPSC